jgi:hypothetical protein
MTSSIKCECGLNNKCTPLCPMYEENKMKINVNTTDDFGFSLVSEKELRQHEEMLKKKVEEQSKVVVKTTQDLTDKLHGLRDMIMPLLVNLSGDPEKDYILWPDRSVKIKTFIKKVNDYVDSE